MSSLALVPSLIVLGWTICLKKASESKKKTVLLVASFVYGLMLESLTITFFGAYSYSSLFLDVFNGVPVYIGLLWSITIFTGLEIGKKIGKDYLSVSMLVSGIALLVDLSIEFQAVSMGLWSWNHNFLPVNPGNFIGWILASFFFTYIWQRTEKSFKLSSRATISILGALAFLISSLYIWIKFFQKIQVLGGPRSLEATIVTTLSIIICLRTFRKVIKSRNIENRIFSGIITGLTGFQITYILITDQINPLNLIPYLILVLMAVFNSYSHK